ncbi:hypothetical protein B0T18DRAFT_220135 [Schizothecium vesticola]|uniref:Uncharacterized protein n=1 Tax=Schizothecium vesticola TaxID=314040 RepID=A0AA40K017_9PEZI|nr:hypothetical protein B0T18DRAFT_220135 [Schizothecium vesticola]
MSSYQPTTPHRPPESPRCDVGFQPRPGSSGCPLASSIFLDLACSRPSSAIHSYHRFAKSGPRVLGFLSQAHDPPRLGSLAPHPLTSARHAKHLPWGAWASKDAAIDEHLNP